MFEASFRKIFGGFLNTEGFCRVFIPGLRGLLSYSYIKSKKFLWGERLGFLSSRFPVSSPPFFLLFILRCILRVCFGQSGVLKSIV